MYARAFPLASLQLGSEVVHHERNSGCGAALQSLFKRARDSKGDIPVTPQVSRTRLMKKAKKLGVSDA